MSRSAKVYIKGIYAGLLTEIDREHYSFCYDTDYYNNPQLPAVSLTMPKTQQEYTSSYLFPVFFNMTSEGDNRIIQAFTGTGKPWREKGNGRIWTGRSG